MLGINGVVRGAEFLLTAYGSSIQSAIQLVDLGGALRFDRLDECTRGRVD